MREMEGNFLRWVALGFVVAVVVGTIAVRAEATPVTAVGDVLATVDIPAAARCGGITGGTALAVVPGGKFGFPKIPILLVTSCIDGGQAKLFFLDPSTNPATLVQPPPPRTNPIITTENPSAGWGALALRADQVDLIACTVTVSGTAIFSIDFSPFNNVPDGQATFLLNGPADSSCKGIAWDISNVSGGPGTIYQSPSTGTNILRFPATGPALSPISSGCDGSVTSMGVAGRSLFVACPPSQGNGQSSIRQLNKTSTSIPAALVRSFTGPTSFPLGLSADPVSFGSEFKDILWSKDQNVAQLKAAYIPGGTIGQAVGDPIAFPAACPSTYPTMADGTALDSDGDGLLDCWEDGSLWSDGLPGISFTGTWTGNPADRHLTLCVDVNDVNAAGVFDPAVECASKVHKDLFVEIDWMVFHNPDVSAPSAIPNVVAAFAAAPMPNPDGTNGVRLHVQRSEEIPHNDKTAFEPCTPAPATGDATFDVLKAQWFGTLAERSANPPGHALNARGYGYRYGVFAHNQTGALNTSSGCGEIGGNDFMVSLGSWGPYNFGTAKKPNWHNVGTLDHQSGTFMHEFGHTLNLRHGGGDNINCKPNYPSVMNYPLQFSSPVNPRPLDYSRQLLGVPINTPSGVVIGLDKANLNESQGVGGFVGKVVFGPVPSGGSVTVAPAGGALDWNKNGIATDILNVIIDINQTTAENGGCPLAQGTILEGFDDWANIQYNVLASFDHAAGAKATHEEKKAGGNLEIQLGEALDLSLDKIDIKPADPKNLISVGNSQTLNVAIFSRGGDAPLDATDLNPSTVTLRGTDGFTWVLPVKQNAQGNFLCKTQDANSDGLPDSICQFDLPRNTISVLETKAVLDGMTFTGQPIHSSDFINPK